MGVAPTGQIFKGFTFDGESSKDYGIYITGSAVYNAPVRDVEMISIPGRNGSFALDKGRFENIEVTYPAGIYADTESDFAQGISDFRNFLASRQGYVELSDDYNVGEYRLAVYKSGLDVSPEQLRAGEFEITFECKPQRFLTSGETEETLSSGDDITNPTLFDAKPLLVVWGGGRIYIGGIAVDPVVIYAEDVGDVILTNAKSDNVNMQFGGSGTVTRGPRYPYTAWDTAQLNVGDTITVPDITFTIQTRKDTSDAGVWNSWDYTITSETFGNNPTITNKVSVISGVLRYCQVLIPSFTFLQGTSWTKSITINLWVIYAGNTYNLPYTLEFAYDGTNNITWKLTVAQFSKLASTVTVNFPVLTGFSTLQTNFSPTYVDLDIGEAYGIVSDEYVSANKAVSFPTEMPALKPGANRIYYDNTITQLKVVPRWWKV